MHQQLHSCLCSLQMTDIKDAISVTPQQDCLHFLSSGNTSQGRKTKIFSFLHNLFISHLTSSNPCSNQCNNNTPFSQLIRHFTQWQTCIRTPTGCKVNISRALQLYKYLYKHHSWLIFVHISVLFSINMCRLNQSHEPPPLVDVC